GVDLARVPVVDAVATAALVHREDGDPSARDELPDMLRVAVPAPRRTPEGPVAPDRERAGVDLLAAVAVHVRRSRRVVTLPPGCPVAGRVAVEDPVRGQLPVPPVQGGHREPGVIAALLDDAG